MSINSYKDLVSLITHKEILNIIEKSSDKKNTIVTIIDMLRDGNNILSIKQMFEREDDEFYEKFDSLDAIQFYYQNAILSINSETFDEYIDAISEIVLIKASYDEHNQKKFINIVNDVRSELGNLVKEINFVTSLTELFMHFDNKKINIISEEELKNATAALLFGTKSLSDLEKDFDINTNIIKF